MQEKIIQKYDLTPAQAETAVALVRGETVVDFASRKGCSVATVRSHVRAIFGKTGVNRQVDLIRLLMAE
jgi:DNA-binding CsgD family transcriptional regulator